MIIHGETMIPIYQTRFGKPDGNCFEAALASILELKLEDIPEFGNDEFWYDRFSAYMVDEYDLQPLDILVKGFPQKPIGYHLAHGKSPRGDFDHTIVALSGHPVHDPHPEGDCELLTTDTYTVFLKIFRPNAGRQNESSNQPDNPE